MSVKRYELTDNGVEVFSDGRYVLHSDYADLLARHNALKEAVARERSFPLELVARNGTMKMHMEYQAARAEVERLIGEDR